jgi:hypothetical protein
MVHNVIILKFQFFQKKTIFFLISCKKNTKKHDTKNNSFCKEYKM